MRRFSRLSVVCLLLCLLLGVSNAVSAQAESYTGLLNNEATFETLAEVRVSAPIDVASYDGNKSGNWISHPLLDDYPCDTAYVYRSSNMFGGRTPWRNNTNFVVFVEQHFEDKESAKAWLDATGLIEIIEQTKGSILLITPGDGVAFNEKDAELYYNLETAQGSAGVTKEVNGEKYSFAEGEYFGGFSYRFAFAVDGGATYFNNYIATNEEYMGRFAGVALIGGQMAEDSFLPNLLPAYLQKTGEDVVAKYVRGNIAGFDMKYAKGTSYVSPANEAAQVKVEKDESMSMRDFFAEAYYGMFRNIQRQPVGLKALLTSDKPYADYVCDQSPYSLSKRTWFVDETPSTEDAVGITDGGIVVQGFYSQTIFADYADSKGKYIDTWFEYVPQEINDVEEGTMPLVVVLHGNDDDMRVVVQQAGWIDVAEADRVALIAPDHQGHAGQNEKADSIVRLVEYFCEKYPAIDRSRIYVTGFSMGGGATSSVAAWRPEVFAAAAPMAMLATTSAVEGAEERVAAINAAYDIPIFFYMSTGDNYVMTTDFYNGQLKEKWPSILNDMLAINEIPAIEYDFSVNVPFGFTGDVSETYVINNEYDGGREIFYKDGVPMFVVNYSREIIHALWSPQAWQVWPDMKQYSRDLETGAVVWTKEEAADSAAAVESSIPEVSGASAERQVNESGNYFYDYDKSAYDMPMFEGQETTIKEFLIGHGSSSFDVEQFINSSYGEIYAKQAELWCNYRDAMDPELLNYYANMGLKKEFYHPADAADNTQDYYVFTPLTMEDGKEYPVVIVNHGHGATARVAEKFGWCEIAARDGLILVMPQTTTNDSLRSILDEVKANYPVDASRVYVTGTSAGAIASKRFAAAYPNEIAAIAPMNVGFSFTEDEADFAQIQRLGGMPMIFLSGSADYYHVLPMCGESRLGSLAGWNGLMKLFGFESWQVTEAESEELATTSLNVLENYTGLRLPTPIVYEYVNNRTFQSNFADENGDVLLSIVVNENGTHDPIGYDAELAWAFMKQFSRNTETGMLVKDGK